MMKPFIHRGVSYFKKWEITNLLLRISNKQLKKQTRKVWNLIIGLSIILESHFLNQVMQGKLLVH